MFEWLKRKKKPFAMQIQTIGTPGSNGRAYPSSTVDDAVKRYNASATHDDPQFEDPDNTGILRLEKLAIPACLVLTYANDPDGEEESTVEFVNSALIPSIILTAMHGNRRLIRFAVYSELIRSDDIEQAEYDMRRYTIPDEILSAMNSEDTGIKINSRGFIVKDTPAE